MDSTQSKVMRQMKQIYAITNNSNFIIAIWVIFTLISSIYSPASNDDGGFHHQAAFIAGGHIPVLDFYATHSVWTYLPFSAVIAALGQQLESIRVFTVLIYLLEIIMLVKIIGDRWDMNFRYYVIFLFGFSSFWFENNSEVSHSVPTNMALIASVFLINDIDNQKNKLLSIFALGICASIAVNARSPLFPLIFIYLYYIFSIRKIINRNFYVVLIVFCVGSIIPATVNFYILIKDPEALIFDYLISHLQLQLVEPDSHSLILERLLVPLTVLMKPDWGYLGSNIFITLPMVVGLALASYGKNRREFWNGLWSSPLLRLCLLLIVGIITCYAIADSVKTKYFNHILPFSLIILLACAWHLRTGRIMTALLWVFATASVVVYLFIGSMDILKRDYAARLRPTTINAIACWLEQNTPPGSAIMNYSGSPVVAANRWLPRGLEQAGGLVPISWIYSTPEQSQRFHMLSYQGFQSLVTSGAIPVFVDDGEGFGLSRDYMERNLPGFNELIDGNYQSIGRVGTVDYYDILVHRKFLSTHTLTPLPRLKENPFHHPDFRRAVSQRDIRTVATFILRETARSLSSLPQDISNSVARAFGSSGKYPCLPELSGQER